MTEVIDGWTIQVHRDRVTGVILDPRGQSFSIAADRFIPMDVIVAAFRIWTAAQDIA